MTTRAIPRIELWNDLGCISGAHRFATGGVVRQWSAAQSTVSETGQESFSYTIPLVAEAAGVVREGQVSRAWRSDTDYDEWLVRKVAKTRDQGGRVDVECGPVSYRLAESGPVPDIVTPTRESPLLAGGFSGLTFGQFVTNYLVTNAPVIAVLPFLGLGTIAAAAASVTFDLEWDTLSAQALINAALAQLEAAAQLPFIWRLVRNGSVSYDITVFAVT